jgi:hypothetical protein
MSELTLLVAEVAGTNVSHWNESLQVTNKGVLIFLW